VLARALLLLGLSSLVSCAAPDAGPLAVHVEWGLIEPSATIPAGVTHIRIATTIEGRDMPEEIIRSVAMLEDEDGNGRGEHDQVIPPGVPVTISVQGLGGPAGPVLFVGHTGTFVLQHGERRFVDIRMYPVNEPGMLDSPTLTARFLHTATRLNDGRVLITGGFDRLTPTPCPVGTVDVDARCFGVTATAGAALFDLGTGRAVPTRSPMLTERAGHTATLLPDGRVLIAGGAETATLVFEHQDGGYSFRLAPGAGGDSFEIFDPNGDPEAEDIDRDGDPARGAFVGAADDVETLGRLDTARVMHAATLLPEGRVLLAGGVRSADSYTVFDPQRAGGYGVLGIEALSSERAAPSAVTLGTGAMTRGWVIGGGDPASNDDVAELWRAGTGSDVIGSSLPATMSGFPGTPSMPRPEFSLFRPLVERINEGRHAVVVGWYGPRCTAGSPAFDAASPYCPYAAASLRSFTIDASTGAATPTMVRNAHAFGASAVLDDGRVVITGGVLGLNFQAGNTIDVFSGAVAAGAASLADVRPLLGRARAFHTTVALPDQGFMTFGGIAPAADIASISLVPGVEIQFLR
jgi:hypothetical protein